MRPPPPVPLTAPAIVSGAPNTAGLGSAANVIDRLPVAVVKLASSPLAVPPTSTVTNRKWYRVSGFSPSTRVATPTAFVPAGRAAG